MNEAEWRKWECAFCGYVYNEETGDPANNIKAGTRWEDLPKKWYCPGCGSGKADFEQI